MAYPDVFGDEDESVLLSGASGLGAAAGWLGALTSLTLIAGLGIWVWDLATRDATQVPVVRAMEGPARVAPEDPGGFEAAHKGYSVNSIASEADQPPLSERVVLAPEPTGPSQADVAASAPAARPSPTDPQDAMRSAVEGALSEVLGVPTQGEAAPADTPSEPDASSLVPRPDPRPESDLVTRASLELAPLPAGEARSATGTPMLSPDDIPPGTRLVQLGTFDTSDLAQARWDTLSERFADYLAPRAQVVSPVDYGGGRAYRLRAHGFDDLGDARAFCAVLLAEKADCIPVLTR